jgi:hypothetical protein
MGNSVTPKPPIAPVIADTGCLGHVLFSCRGYRAFDRHDHELGVFADPAAAVTAILTAPST